MKTSLSEITNDQASALVKNRCKRGLPRQRDLRRQPTCDPCQLKLLVGRGSKRQVAASDIMNGEFLPKLASENVGAFLELAPSRQVAPARQLTRASACSGSGGDKLVQRAMASAYQSQGIAIEFETLFDCEIDTGKIKYLKMLQESINPGVSPCLFKDICQLGCQAAECVVHDGKCPVRGADIFVCCTSRKDVARPNTKNKSDVGVFQKNMSPGGSAQTWQGFLNYLEAHRPAVFFYENSDVIADDTPSTGQAKNSSRDVLLSEIASRGYEAQPMTLASEFFGVPQSRRRFYMMGVLTKSCQALDFSRRSFQDIFATFRAFLQVTQRMPPCANDLLLPDSDPCVEAELQRRLSKPVRKSKYDVKKYQQMFGSHGLRWGETRPPKEVGDSPWWPTLSAEQQDSCIFSLATDSSECLMRDLLWSIGKVRTSSCSPSGHVSFTVIPKQVVMVFPDDGNPRLQLGREAMLLQGFPLPKPGSPIASVKESMWHELAGNMVTLPCCLNILMSIVAALDWRQTPTVSSCAEELEAAEEASDLILQMVVGADEEDTIKKPRLR